MEEKLWFRNSGGTKLCGILSDPDPEKNDQAVIMAHGNSSSKESPVYLRLEKELNSIGIAVLDLISLRTVKAKGTMRISRSAKALMM